MQVVKIKKRRIVLNFVVIALSVAVGWYIKAKLTPQAGGMMGMGGAVPHVLVEDVKTVDVSPHKKYIASVEAIFDWKQYLKENFGDKQDDTVDDTQANP